MISLPKCPVTGKDCYPDRATANENLAILKRTPGMRNPGAMVVYRCKFCANLHTGHSHDKPAKPKPGAKGGR